jgi:Ca-activated chloride channel family protein
MLPASLLHRSFAFVVLIGLAFAPALIVRAQDQDDPPPPTRRVKPAQTQKQDQEDVDPGEVISVRTSEVLLPVTVRDFSGKLVTDLKRNDFRVFENDKEQPVTEFALRQVPVDVVLMVDASSSVANNLEDFQRAASTFAEMLSPEDRISLIKFDDRVELLQDWTTSRVQFRRSLNRITPGMFTKFYDALYLASKEQFKPDKRRHAVVVLTDGIDSGRGYASGPMAMRALLELQATVYVISNTEIERKKKESDLAELMNQSDSAVKFNELRIGDLRLGLQALDLSEKNLSVLTGATGGQLYKPESFEGLDEVYRNIAEELRHQYVLYYQPTDSSADGSLRRTRVQVSNRFYVVTTRSGYYAAGTRNQRKGR